jgi:sarcosine oxidase subunit beta
VKYDTLIIGGGAWGCSTAFHLSRNRNANGKIAVIERGYIPYGQSGHTSAIIRQFYASPSTARLAKLSLAFIRNFRKFTGSDPFFKRTGMLVISDERDEISRTVDVLRRERIRCSVIERSEALRLEPGIFIGEDETVAFEPDAGFVNPAAATSGFAGAAERNGVSIFQGTDVSEIRRTADGWSVKTNRGFFDAIRLVIVAGTNTPRLAFMAGLQLPVYMLSFPVCYFLRPKRFKSARRVIFDGVNDYYSRPEGNDQILLGAMHSEMSYGSASAFTLPESMHWSKCDPDFLGRVNFETVSGFSSGFLSRFPGMKHAVVCRDFMPYIDITPDWEPILDSAASFGHDDLYIGCGSSGHGFKLSPMAGKILSELVTDGRVSSADVSAYSISRFKSRSAVF